ncbi:MAG: hypothetical protein GY861_20765 [bacterium]|nr:hypothetical protein [bacterium]
MNKLDLNIRPDSLQVGDFLRSIGRDHVLTPKQIDDVVNSVNISGVISSVGGNVALVNELFYYSKGEISSKGVATNRSSKAPTNVKAISRRKAVEELNNTRRTLTFVKNTGGGESPVYHRMEVSSGHTVTVYPHKQYCDRMMSPGEYSGTIVVYGSKKVVFFIPGGVSSSRQKIDLWAATQDVGQSRKKSTQVAVEPTALVFNQSDVDNLKGYLDELDASSKQESALLEGIVKYGDVDELYQELVEEVLESRASLLDKDDLKSSLSSVVKFFLHSQKEVKSSALLRNSEASRKKANSLKTSMGLRLAELEAENADYVDSLYLILEKIPREVQKDEKREAVGMPLFSCSINDQLVVGAAKIGEVISNFLEEEAPQIHEEQVSSVRKSYEAQIALEEAQAARFESEWDELEQPYRKCEDILRRVVPYVKDNSCVAGALTILEL